jgi:hypothetical protein
VWLTQRRDITKKESGCFPPLSPRVVPRAQGAGHVTPTLRGSRLQCALRLKPGTTSIKKTCPRASRDMEAHAKIEANSSKYVIRRIILLTQEIMRVFVDVAAREPTGGTSPSRIQANESSVETCHKANGRRTTDGLMRAPWPRCIFRGGTSAPRPMVVVCVPRKAWPRVASNLRRNETTREEDDEVAIEPGEPGVADETRDAPRPEEDPVVIVRQSAMALRVSGLHGAAPAGELL